MKWEPKAGDICVYESNVADPIYYMVVNVSGSKLEGYLGKGQAEICLISFNRVGVIEPSLTGNAWRNVAYVGSTEALKFTGINIAEVLKNIGRYAQQEVKK